jgi:hypothetical protein
MGMSINYQNDNNLSVFHLNGEKTFYEAMDVWNRILQAIKLDSPHAVLVHDNSVSKLDCCDVLTIEEWFNEINFPRNFKIAIIDADLTFNSMNKFADDVVYNRGWFNIKVFKDEAHAREWLEQEQ